MKRLAMMVLFSAAVACGPPEDEPPRSCHNITDQGSLACVPLDVNPGRFYVIQVPIWNWIEFYTCDCHLSRTVQVLDTAPIASNPYARECFALMRGTMSYDCGGITPDGRQVGCLPAVGWGGSVFCHDMHY